MKLLVWVAIVGLLALGVRALLRAGRGTPGLSPDPEEPKPKPVLDAPGPEPTAVETKAEPVLEETSIRPVPVPENNESDSTRDWVRSVPVGTSTVRVTRVEELERGARNRYHVELRSAGEQREVDIEIPDWIPDLLAVDESISFLAFAREDEEHRGYWETRTYTVELTNGQLVHQTDARGTLRGMKFSGSTLVVRIGDTEHRHDIG